MDFGVAEILGDGRAADVLDVGSAQGFRFQLELAEVGREVEAAAGRQPA